MKTCSLNHFTESLAPWLDKNYLRNVRFEANDRIVFSFHDGVSDTYRVSDCDQRQLQKVCQNLKRKGIQVTGLP